MKNLCGNYNFNDISNKMKNDDDLFVTSHSIKYVFIFGSMYICNIISECMNDYY